MKVSYTHAELTMDPKHHQTESFEDISGVVSSSGSTEDISDYEEQPTSTTKLKSQRTKAHPDKRKVQPYTTERSRSTPGKDNSIFVSKLSPHAITPRKYTRGSAGFDICTPVFISVNAYSSYRVKTRLTFMIPEGYYGRLATRSGLASEYSIDVQGGVIDRDYRGEVMVLLFNHGSRPVKFAAGTRIAQIIFEKIHKADNLKVVTSLDKTSRGGGGFGSTGIQSSK